MTFSMRFHKTRSFIVLNLPSTLFGVGVAPTTLILGLGLKPSSISKSSLDYLNNTWQSAVDHSKAIQTFWFPRGGRGWDYGKPCILYNFCNITTQFVYLLADIHRWIWQQTIWDQKRPPRRTGGHSLHS